MEENLYAIAEYVPSGKQRRIQQGKPYRLWDHDIDEREFFGITDETGDHIFCLAVSCAFLGGHDWTIVTEPDLTPEQRRMAGLPTEDATIAELRERIEALEARVPVEEKAEPEGPREDDEYFWITSGGMAAMSHWGNIIIDEERCKFLGVYKTQEEAERRAKQVRIVIKELNNGHPVKLRDGQGTLMP